MKNYYWILFMLALFACNSGINTADNEMPPENPLVGNWQFLDKYGNYNEALFSDSTYQTMNQFMRQEFKFKYFIKNDSLYTTLDKRKKGMSAIASVVWINEQQVVLSTEFVSDTLSRMEDEKNTMADLHPFKDSVVFFPAFHKRYENYLISRGIVSKEEVEQFREQGRIPDDIQSDRNK